MCEGSGWGLGRGLVSPWTYLDLLGHAWSYQCSRFASASLPDLVLISLCRQNLSVRRGR